MKFVSFLKSSFKLQYFKVFVFILMMASLQISSSLASSVLYTTELPELDLTQTAHIKTVFLGVPPESIDNQSFVTRVSQKVSQFAEPNTITWTLNVSVDFQDFPEDVLSSLINNSFVFENTTYYNITLFDSLLIQSGYLTIPDQGYLFVYMWLPDNISDHSWFYVQERPDLLLGRIDYFDGQEVNAWAFPYNFGGLHRSMYFDISQVMELNLTKLINTNFVVNLFRNSLRDVFTNLLGYLDPQWIDADMQRYENYTVKILWFNGTGGPLYPERIKEEFEDFMPWTNWAVEIKTRQMDSALNKLLEDQTEELSSPLTHIIQFPNGSRFTEKAWRNLDWVPYKEDDIINSYFYDHVREYFNLTNPEDKSVIPVVFLQLRNDTAACGAVGMGTGVCWFTHGIVIIAFQGSLATGDEVTGSIFLTYLLRHELGHWVSLSHHTSLTGDLRPKIICSMRSLTNKFCAFCKDARARMSFISYYKAVVEILEENQEKASNYYDTVNVALQLFYDWKYEQALDTIVAVYRSVEETGAYILPLDYIVSILLAISGAMVLLVLIIKKKTILVQKIKKQRVKAEES